MEPHLYPQQWLQLSWDVKYKLSSIFNFAPNGVRHVVDNQLVEDGFLASDLAVVDEPRLQTYLGSKETDFMKLWRATIEKVTKEMQLSLPKLSEEEAKQFNEEYTTRVQPKKQVKKRGK